MKSITFFGKYYAFAEMGLEAYQRRPRRTDWKLSLPASRPLAVSKNVRLLHFYYSDSE